MAKLPQKDLSKGKKGNSSGPGALVFKPKRDPTKILIIATLVVYIGVVGGFYGILASYKNSIRSEIQTKKQKVKEWRQEERAPLAREALNFKYRADNLQKLLKDHRDWIAVFNFLERATLPKVQYLELSGNYEEKVLRLRGLTTSYRNLARQIYVFKNAPAVKDMNISTPQLKDEGIGFKMELEIAAGLWNSED